MGWLQEFKISDVLKGVWSDIINLPRGVVEDVKKVTPKWVKDIDVGEFFSGVGKDFKSGTKSFFKGVGDIIQTAVGALTPTLIILALIALGVLVFWKQIKKAV